MKTTIRLIVVGAFLATVASASAAMDNGASTLPARETSLQPAPVIVSHQTALSAKELAKYQQLEQVAKAKTEKQAAGAGMDTTTIVVVGVLVAVVAVAIASGSGGGGAGGSAY